MATLIFLALCVLGEGFLVYVLVHFIQEERRGRVGSRPSRVNPNSTTVAKRKVIPITNREEYKGEARTERVHILGRSVRET